MQNLMQHSSVVVRQRKELAELLGFETRNKYEILDQNGQLLFYCAEMQKGVLGFLFRQLLGHWRSFELHFFDTNKQMLWRAEHPFRFIFSRLDAFLQNGQVLGYVEWKWGIFRKRYAMEEAQSRRQLEIESGFFSFWTFPITFGSQEVAKITKKWTGTLKEIFTDADNFVVEFSPMMNERERALVLCAAVLIDLKHFENKAGD